MLRISFLTLDTRVVCVFTCLCDVRAHAGVLCQRLEKDIRCPALSLSALSLRQDLSLSP